MRKRTASRGQGTSYRSVTVFSYGGTRSGKTHYFSTFPRPLFLSVADEGGDETLDTMDPAWWYEPDVAPDVWLIESQNDMAAAVGDLRAISAYDSTHYSSVFIDSLTFYQQMYFGKLLQAAGAAADTRALYGQLANHLQWLRSELHGLGLNVGWTALDDPPSTEKRVGGPLLIGKSERMFPSSCSYILYHQLLRTKEGEPFFQIRTKSFDAWRLGGRCELPDPLPGLSYRDLAEAIGIPLPVLQPRKPLRPSVAPAVSAPSSVVTAPKPRVVKFNSAASQPRTQ